MKIRLLLAAAVVALAANGAALAREQTLHRTKDPARARPPDLRRAARRLRRGSQVGRREVDRTPVASRANPGKSRAGSQIEAARHPPHGDRRNLHEVLPAVSAGLCPACPFERTAARRTVPKSLQRHCGGTARCHHGARPGETHEGARCRSTKRSGRPAGPSEGTGRRTPESAGRPARWKCGACGRRSTNCCLRNRCR